jgi:tetratricopeptide (TPR) repeat protein
MTETADLMHAAVRMARNGAREQALRAFEQVVGQTPEEAEAWLWISELSDTLDEQVNALDRAVACIDASVDTTRTLQDRLNAIRGAQALPAPTISPVQPSAENPDSSENDDCSDTVFQWAERLVILGEEREARQQLETLLEVEPCHERALMLLSELVTAHDEQILLLERVLEINPANATAALRADTLHAQAALNHHAPSNTPHQRQGLLRRAIKIFSR